MATVLFTQNIIACIWDFDKTLIPGYMQSPLFRHYNIDEARSWEETNSLAEHYKQRGYNASGESIYLNHLLSYVRNGPLKGLNNKILQECGKEIEFYEGIPQFFQTLKQLVQSKAEYRKHDISLEHYIVSTGLAEIIRGSLIGKEVEDLWGCEFIENPLPPGFLSQKELLIDGDREISQIGTMIDNTTKTRALFEINKGTNKNPAIDVNANINPEDRRIPFQNMIYIADGPSDIPSFSVVKSNGGKTYAVYKPGSTEEFEQNDRLLQVGRIHAYGQARYTPESNTSMWLQMHVQHICDRIVTDREAAVSKKVSKPPRHLDDENRKPEKQNPSQLEQDSFL
ncbi:MAG: haloacid dehalogenase-like hydrolase [Opitutaceae bacterium]|nr:haloacid dehalogenase-like hydrolase [Opitutaceae bacterium]